ncbi:MAG TPA: TMEM175 family protein [Candidatus Angelobacter sp.]|jgi:uncharacterized membrane protein|nr:TMEM175 family protein [Candidatus Angelobacter sp.]
MSLSMIAAKVIPGEKHFRWRAGDISRLEGFTDAVFALAVTLLIVSVDTSKNFEDLIRAIKGFPAFAATFAILIWSWYHHYIYSRRYGLQTAYTVFLNSVLLFVVLFYVYPLKFVFSIFIGSLLRIETQQHLQEVIDGSQVPLLMVIYSLGFTAVFAVFALLYRYAYTKRKELELNDYESLLTRHAIISHAGTAILGLVVGTTALLLPVQYAGLSGYLYCLIGVYHGILGAKFGQQEKTLLQRMEAEAHEIPSVPNGG